jgi:hypothetical protein
VVSQTEKKESPRQTGFRGLRTFGIPWIPFSTLKLDLYFLIYSILTINANVKNSAFSGYICVNISEIQINKLGCLVTRAESNSLVDDNCVTRPDGRNTKTTQFLPDGALKNHNLISCSGKIWSCAHICFKIRKFYRANRKSTHGFRRRNNNGEINKRYQPCWYLRNFLLNLKFYFKFYSYISYIVLTKQYPNLLICISSYIAY